MAGLDAKGKSIIKEMVESQSIKKETIKFDASLLECDLTTKELNSQSFPQSSASTKQKQKITKTNSSSYNLQKRRIL